MWTLSGFIDEISPDFTEQCAVAAGLGLRYTEVRSAWGINILDLKPEQITTVKETLADHGLAVSSIGSPIGKIYIDEEFGPHLEDRANSFYIAGADRLRQASDGDAIHVGFQLWPAFETVGAGNHELRVVQSEIGGVGVVVMSVHFSDRIRLASQKPTEQFFSLPFELIEVGVLAKAASR